MTTVVLAALAAFFAALVTVFSKAGVQGIDAAFATTLRSIIMAIFLVVMSAALGRFHTEALPDTRSLIFIALAGIAGALSWLTGFEALRHGSASVVSAIDRLSLVIIVALSILFLGEPFQWKSIVGSLIVIAGVLIIVL